MPEAFVRFSVAGRSAYGLLEGDTIRELKGHLLDERALTGATLKLADARLLAPCEPSKIIAVGRNYKSHLGERPALAAPGLFAKLPSSIVGPGEGIVLPPGAAEVHYEGEMVLVIGRRAKHIAPGHAAECVFGVTAGNDVSERNWQKSDLQWLRAKGSDTFCPLGPAVVTGLNYDDLLVETRLNGEVRQSQRTRDLIFDVDAIITYVTQFFTLLPGDLIFTGTPGATQAMKPGDLVEVEVEGVGVLRNPVVASSPEAG
jgi:2-keto-4-pentenoate hydratase/2-oxohepta-3-ene-1,7-dioic acid hydratase in catechol pathway